MLGLRSSGSLKRRCGDWGWRRLSWTLSSIAAVQKLMTQRWAGPMIERTTIRPVRPHQAHGEQRFGLIGARSNCNAYPRVPRPAMLGSPSASKTSGIVLRRPCVDGNVTDRECHGGVDGEDAEVDAAERNELQRASETPAGKYFVRAWRPRVLARQAAGSNQTRLQLQLRLRARVRRRADALDARNRPEQRTGENLDRRRQYRDMRAARYEKASAPRTYSVCEAIPGKRCLS